MLELILVLISCSILGLVPETQKDKNEVRSSKVGYPYYCFEGEVLSD
jgi:hypothetical protein